jgi:hypothetical protein
VTLHSGAKITASVEQPMRRSQHGYCDLPPLASPLGVQRLLL